MPYTVGQLVTAANMNSLDHPALDYAQITADTTHTATTEGTSTSVITGNSVTYPAELLRIEFWAPAIYETGGASPATLVIYRDTTVLAAVPVNTTSVTAALNYPVGVVVYDTPTAAAHTYKVFAFQTGGTNVRVAAGAGGSGTKPPAWLRVTKS